MKKQLLVAISLCAGCMCSAQSLNPYYYYFKGEKKSLELNSDYALVGKANPMARSVQTELKKVDLKEVSAADYAAKINLLKNGEGVDYVAPFFTSKNGNTFGMSNLFIVQLKKVEDAEILKNYAKSKGIQVITPNEFSPLWYALSCEGTSMNAMECANMFYESGLFASAAPDFLSIKSAMADSSVPQTSKAKASRIVNGEITTANMLYSDQWGLHNTGQYNGTAGMDINIPSQTWAVGTMPYTPKVAVIDNGVETNHPSLKLVYSYDMETATTPNKVSGSQGTAVAGVIANRPNNGGPLRGVYPYCSLMSISHSYGGDVSTYGFANAILKAYKEGADVINCSWGDSNEEGTEFLDYAVTTAATKGRNGLGCIMVFAAGNDNLSTVNFPARKEEVIAVGAIISNGTRRVPTYGGDWGSNYGTALDIMAPGEWIATTDRMGVNGYNPSNIVNDYTNQNYHKYFAGTAAACPFVSGVAALVLAGNPTLPADVAKRVILNTAKELKAYSYNGLIGSQACPGYPTMSIRNNIYVGSGLANAYEAYLKAYNLRPTITKVSQSASMITYKVSNISTSNPNVKVRWSVSNTTNYTLNEEASGKEKVIVFPSPNAPNAILKGEVYTGGENNVPIKVLYTMSTTLSTISFLNDYKVVQTPGSQTLKLVKTVESAEAMTTRAAVSDVTINLYSNATLVRSEKALSTDREVTMDISGLATGNYVLNVISGGKMILSQTVIIKR